MYSYRIAVSSQRVVGTDMKSGTHPRKPVSVLSVYIARPNSKIPDTRRSRRKITDAGLTMACPREFIPSIRFIFFFSMYLVYSQSRFIGHVHPNRRTFISKSSATRFQRSTKKYIFIKDCFTKDTSIRCAGYTFNPDCTAHGCSILYFQA